MGFLNEVAKGLGTMARKADERQQVNNEQTSAAALKAEVEKDHALFLRQAAEEYETRKEEREISRRLTSVFSQGDWLIDFSPVDSLDTKYRPKLIEILSSELYKTYRDVGRQYLAAEKDSTSTPLIFFYTLGSYLYFPEFAEQLNRSLVHRDYFFSGGSIGSVLTGFKEPGVLAARTPESIRERVFCEGDYSSDDETSPFAASSLQLVQFSKLIHWYPKRSKYESLIQLLAKAMEEELSPSAEELINSEDPHDWVNGVNIVLGSDKEEDFEYRCLKMALIKSAIEPMDREAFTKVYDFVRDAAICLLSTISIIGEGEDERIVRVPPVDILVADAIIYKRTNNLSQMNQELKEALDLYAGVDFNKRVEFTSLANFFSSIQAYEQEMIVLDKMVEHNIPRSEDQVARLAFLHAGGVRHAGKTLLSNQINYAKEDGKIAVDYRTLSWDAQELSMYFTSASGSNRYADTPLVIAEWSKNISTNSTHWDSAAVTDALGKSIENEFGDDFSISQNQVGILMDGELDYSDSTLLMPAKQSKYPWLGFVVVGEQISRKQVSVSLFGTYFPELDHTEESSVIQRNQKAASRVAMLKMRQNPKINNFIDTMQSVVVESLEQFFNSSEQSDNIY